MSTIEGPLLSTGSALGSAGAPLQYEDHFLGLEQFEAVTGVPPGWWIMLERLRYARELLERDARATLEDVAATPTMRHHFRKNLGTSPSMYRERAAP
jgi:methylphosphotriester-DNA--protein-cysteine methyltransferase